MTSKTDKLILGFILKEKVSKERFDELITIHQNVPPSVVYAIWYHTTIIITRFLNVA